MPTRDPAATASARHSAPWAIVLFIAGAMAGTVGIVLGNNPLLLLLALALLVAGTVLLGRTALKGGRGDEPRLGTRPL
jgi:hypothetical protein